MTRFLLALLLGPACVGAQITRLFPAQPTSFTTDSAHVVTPATQTLLNAIGSAVQQQLGGDIAVVTLPDIGQYPPNEVAMQIGRTWKVGGRGAPGSEQRNLGVVVLLVPRTPAHKGECFVAPGMGAEGFITDNTAAELCRAHLEELKAGNYDAALLGITQSVEQLIDTHVHPPPPPPPTDWVFIWEVSAVLVVVGVIVFWWLLLRHERREEERRQRRLRAERAYEASRREAAERQAASRREAAERQAALEAEEAARWAALTPEQQEAERRETERRRRVAEAAAAARRQREEEEEAERRRRSSSYYDLGSDYGSSSSSSSSSSSGSDFGGFGGGGGFDGGGGGSSF